MARTATTADIFNALGDESRRSILETLAARDATVTDLAARLHMPQPQLSKHLKVLREVDVVRCRQAGRQRIYRLHEPALEPLHTWLTRLTAAVNEHYDRLDDYLHELQQDALHGNGSDDNNDNDNDNDDDDGINTDSNHTHKDD
jgi:DNA-binding transcriptional ArsR family regulator